MQGNSVPNYKRSPKHLQRQYQRNNLNFRLIQLKHQRFFRNSQSRLSLNKLEKDVLIVGLVFMMGLMFTLVGTKVTNDVYQHQSMVINANITKFHNLNNNSRQKISDLQNSDRLQKIAHQNHLTFSNRAVRNVK